jgi:glycosyltransferase involved in cell wall biosynthesis
MTYTLVCKKPFDGTEIFLRSSAMSPEGAGSRLISIVIPARNEEANIPRLEAELLAVVDQLPYRYEFIVVDNDSSDQTGALVKEICRRDPRWRYIRFSRNFTVEASISAGYRAARGDAMIVLYSDLQDPPSAIPRLLEKWEEGWDVVYGIRTVRPGDPKWRNAAVRVAYRAISRLSDVPIPPDAGDFRLITRQVRNALNQCGEYNRYLRGLISWLGFRQVGVIYERQPRTGGKSNVSIFDLIVFVFTAITSFSLKPLRLFSAFGFGVLGLTMLGIPIYAGLYLTGNPPPGITTVIILLLMAIGINSVGVGILGEYLGRTHAEVRRRPLFVIAESVNIDGEGDVLRTTDGPDTPSGERPLAVTWEPLRAD